MISPTCSHKQDVTWGAVSFSGDPVPNREWLAKEYQRRHCSIPLQGRGPQQNSHWWLPWREVRIKIDFFLYLTSSLSYSLSSFTSTYVVEKQKSNSERIFSVLLRFRFVWHTPILSQTQLLVPHSDRPVKKMSVAQYSPSVCDYLTHS